MPAPHATGPAALDGRAAGLMTLICLVWALQQVSLKAVAAQASPMLMVGLRSLLALALLLPLLRWRGERLADGPWRAGALAGLLFGVEYLLVAAALQRTHAAHVVVFLYTAPLFAALALHRLVPGERLGRVQGLGIGLAFAGLVLAFLGEGPAAGADARSMRLGDGLALLAGLAWAATTVTIRCTALARAPATQMLGYQLIGGAALLPLAWAAGPAPFEPTAQVLAHLGFQSLVVSFASILVWCWLLRRYRAGPLGVFSFLTPLFGVALGAWLLGEPLAAPFLAGSGLVLAGIALVSGPAARAPGRGRG